MNFSILIPHFRQGQITAYAISQLLKYKGKHEVEIIVIDNSIGHDSYKYLEPLKEHFTYLAYPSHLIQSHGNAFNYALELGYVSNEYFITIESDSFPTKDNWLNYYEYLINEGFDCAGSILSLSGGSYLHPCGTMYRKSIWAEAKKYCDEIEYSYFPNMSNREGFDCHLMVHNSVVDSFLNCPDDYIELAKNYKGLSKEEMIAKMEYYKPIVAPFHNGMGTRQESVKTYGSRNTESEPQTILLNNKQKLINRIGYEPGQWFYFYQVAVGKKIAAIPTEIKWMKNRGAQQQEYTLMENGFKHLWAGSSYLDMKNTGLNDVYEFKKNQIEGLYNSLPDNQKI